MRSAHTQLKKKKDKRLLVLLFFVISILMAGGIRNVSPSHTSEIVWQPTNHTDQTRTALPTLAAHPAGSVKYTNAELSPHLAFLLGDKLPINRARKSELELLPMIGPTLAQRIVDYRKQHGNFTSPQDLQKVVGIGPKILRSVSGLIAFSQ